MGIVLLCRENLKVACPLAKATKPVYLSIDFVIINLEHSSCRLQINGRRQNPLISHHVAPRIAKNRPRSTPHLDCPTTVSPDPLHVRVTVSYMVTDSQLR